MRTRINLRFAGMPSIDWLDELRGRIDEKGISPSITLTPPSIPPGYLGAIDPNVAIAIITGGAEVLAALITVLGALWVEKHKGKDTSDTPKNVVVVIQGSKGTVDLSGLLAGELSNFGEDSAQQVSKSNNLLHALEGVGTVREVEVK